ncbi:MAG: leucine-rich repeat protein, partial [Treponema sp.]|nr:leucine-rich repeat protein [Treponema sp.]
IFIGGVLTGSQIGVYVPFEDTNKPTAGTPKGFTSGYSNENSETKPGVIFKTNTDYSVSTDGGSGTFEAAFAVNGGSMYNAYDYTITFAAADSVPTGMYPGETVTFAVKPTIERKEQTGDPTPLYINPANNKLYTGHTGGVYTGIAGDAAVTITANLYSGSGPAASNMSCAVSYNSTDSKEYVTVTIPGQTYPDSYTLKITASYLGRSHTASYSIACNRSAEIVAQAIGRIPNPASVTEYTFVVEGGVGSDATDGLMKVADAIRSHGNNSSVALDNVRINLVASAATKVNSLSDYTSPYFMNCAALKSIVLPDWIEYVLPSLFEGCTKLASVTLSANTQIIMQDGFKNCSSLASITIPAGITGSEEYHGIEAGAFDGCSHLATVNYEGTKAQWGSVVRPATGTWHSGVIATCATCSDGQTPELDWHPSASGEYTVLPAGTDGSEGVGPTVTVESFTVTVTYVTFGLWPQTIKADGVTVDESKTKTVGSFTYYWGSDYEWYAKVYEDAYGANTNTYKYSDGTPITQGGTTYRYFKLEPIKWRVVTDNYNSSGKKLLLCENALAAKRWDSSNTRKTWADSELRAWLNDEFYNAAFTSEEKAVIGGQTNVSNAPDTTRDYHKHDGWNDNTYYNGCPEINDNGVDTQDYVFLPSLAETTRNDYGFFYWLPQTSKCYKQRYRVAVDYARAGRLYLSSGQAWWHTRSLGSFDGTRVWNATGQYQEKNTYSNIDGIVPAICVNP